jgi:hypothetical protein
MEQIKRDAFNGPPTGNRQTNSRIKPKCVRRRSDSVLSVSRRSSFVTGFSVAETVVANNIACMHLFADCRAPLDIESGQADQH